MSDITDQFVEFPKLARLSRECIITEKIDGTNAQIYITDDGRILAGSRNRWITPQDDNFGFAGWVERNKEELLTLGPGRHYGEWWGQGIQRGYGLKEKRFSLFNTIRWCLAGQTPKNIGPGKVQEVLPGCCGLVPVLYQGIFSTEACGLFLEELARTGSRAAPGFMNPEGIVCFHVAANKAFKKTIEKDGLPKSLH